MKGKILLSFLTMMLVGLAFAPLVKAVASIQIYGYTDKPQYMLGEKGTLKFWIYNDGTEDIILKSVMIEYPWNYYYIWEGNETIKDINSAILVNGNWSTSTTFTVPSDSRATGGNIRITVVTDKITPPRSKNVPINVAGAPAYGSLQDMDKLVTLFTVQVVLVIVCTIIIAATIFLSAHRPQVTWRKEEEKAE